MTSPYTAAGEGDPVVLLHGGMSDSTAWGMLTPALVAHHRTFAFDRRGHGRSPDTDAPFHYEDMAQETIRFLEEVVGGPSHLVGWSDGGIVALLVSRLRPELVRRQVVIGTNFHHDGLLDAADPGDDPDGEAAAVFKMLYEATAIDPAHWSEFLAKTNRLWREEPTMTVEDLHDVQAPTLVMVGDDDLIALDHTIALFDSLPNGQLAVVPGTSHVLNLEKPVLVNQLILEFLAETGPPGTLVPVRRA